MQIQLRTKEVKFLLSWSLLSRHSKETIKPVGHIDLELKGDTWAKAVENCWCTNRRFRAINMFLNDSASFRMTPQLKDDIQSPSWNYIYPLTQLSLLPLPHMHCRQKPLWILILQLPKLDMLIPPCLCMCRSFYLECLPTYPHFLMALLSWALRLSLSFSSSDFLKNWEWNCHATQQSHCWAYSPRKPELKEPHVPQCSLQHYLQ